MKRLLLALSLIAFVPAAAEAGSRTVRVKPYVSGNGTYVQPHYRTSPDSSRLNNYSSQGNVNPWTGKKGSKSPW
jgi:hypothetical protein